MGLGFFMKTIVWHERGLIFARMMHSETRILQLFATISFLVSLKKKPLCSRGVLDMDTGWLERVVVSVFFCRPSRLKTMFFVEKAVLSRRELHFRRGPGSAPGGPGKPWPGTGHSMLS